MTKVAHFIDSIDPGGAETLIVEMCRRLPDFDFSVEVLHFGNPWLSEKCAQFRIPASIVPGYKLYKSIITIPLFSIVFAQFLRSRKIDLLHSHLLGPITGASIGSYLARVSHLGTIHDTYSIDERQKRMYLIQLSLIFDTKLVTVSRYIHAYFSNKSALFSNYMKTIYNGIDVELYRVRRKSHIREELLLDPTEIVLISVGRLVAIKGYDVLIESFSQLESLLPLRLLIVGDGPNRKAIEIMIKEKGLVDKVKLLGFRDDVPELLRASDCFVLSSRSEGLSYSIMEAMASGLPQVITDVGGNSELVVDGVSGYLVPVDDHVAFAKKLQILIEDREKRKQFGGVASRIAKEKFSVKAMMDRYVFEYLDMT